jgi:seryl-tRNA synthetase
MHDLKFIRQNPDAFDAGLKRRGVEPQSAAILKLDEDKRKYQAELESLLARRNQLAKQIGQAKAKKEDADGLMKEAKSNNAAISELEAKVNANSPLDNLLATLPNLPAEDTPNGKDENDNKVIRTEGTKPSFSFTPKEHDILGPELGMMDFDTAAKLSGARFTVLKGALARMERALASFMLDIHTQSYGYMEVCPPMLVRDEAVYGTGQLPKFSEDLFKTENDYWLIPTAEVPLTNMVSKSIIDEDDLPLRFTAYTQCFRSEAGSAGKDTRGMIRQHQFSKVELVSITHPDKSLEEHERMTQAAEEVLKQLGLHYQVLELCTGDMGFGAQKTYDLEVWLPGQNAYREISSCSNCGDFQGRRMKARFRKKGEKETRFVHTLNGSGLAIGRTMVAILENYQQEDGTISVPEALRPYMGGLEVIKA